MWILGLKGLNKTVLLKNSKRRYKQHSKYKRRHGWTNFQKIEADCSHVFFLKTYHPNSCSKLFFVYNRAIYMRKNKMRLSLDAS